MTDIDADVQKLRDWVAKQHQLIPDNQKRTRDALLRLSANEILHLFVYTQLLNRSIHLPAVLDGTDDL